MAIDDARSVLWEEIDCANIRPVRTALLAAQGSSFHLIREKRGSSRRVWSTLTSAFLPEGYPESVTSDYLSFQFWDTIQGLCTYIRSMLSTQALLSGIGVGQTTATIMGATFQWFLRDFTGMLGGVIFTIYQGTNLDSKAKQWRLTADFMNDIGMLLDLLSPLFPDLFVILLCVGSLARSVTGVASGATRAALTQHFALQQNAADISAKEGSQETAATLSGMILGMLLANLTAGHTVAIWICFLSLTCFHMYANYKAVGSLCLTSLNKERTSIALHSFLTTGKVPTPLDVSAKEVILPQLFSLSYFSKKVHQPNQHIIFGARISSINIHEGWKIFPQLVKRYAKDNYLMFLQDGKIYVILHKQAKKDDYLKSYIHALVVASLLDNPNIEDAEMSSNVWMQNSYPFFMLELQAHGWNSDRVLVYPDPWRAQWSSSIDLKSE